MTSTPMNSCTCGASVPADAKFCSNCGRSAHVRHATVDQSGNRHGTNIVGTAGRDLVINSGRDADSDVAPGREIIRRILPPDLLSVAAGAIAVGGLLINLISGIPLAVKVVAFVIGIGGAAAVTTLTVGSAQLRRNQFFQLPLGLGALERDDDGSTWLTVPVAPCSKCPEHRTGTMHVVTSPDGPRWICNVNSKHKVDFDFTRMPPLDPPSAI